MIRVVDLTEVSGAFFGRLMVGLGAEVILVEPPGGAPLRSDALTFAHFRAGARSVTLDLGERRDRDRFRDLVATADLLVESLPPGVLASLGLAYADLREL